MTGPALATLPPPLAAASSDWPWADDRTIWSRTMPDGHDWPRITIVTPTLNQGRFIEQTIRSVLLQGYPDLEYIVIDGGSTDETMNVLAHYREHLAYWISEPDRGQSHALNKGFARATGEIIGWLNSDDYHLPHTLRTVATNLASPEGSAAV